MSLTDSAGARSRPIPKSIVTRALQGVRYAITGVAPDTWFGPMQPLAPMAPAEVAGRRFDYPTGYNLNYGPRAYEPVSFADLRALADNCDILRLVIETRKDQIEAQDWDIRPRKQPDGTRPRARQFASAIAAAKSFLACPDREHDFAQWTRAIAEEMFVIDATSLYKRRDRKGRVCAFEIIDGSTIAPRIDAWGRAPQPPDVAYQQILHGVPAADYARGSGFPGSSAPAQGPGLAQMTSDELIYYPRNTRPGHVYGQSPVEQIILTANIVLRRSLHQLAYYTDGNLTDAVFTAPTGWTGDQIHAWQTFWDSLFEGNLRARRHGTWVPEGTKYVPLKDIVLKDAFDEYLARIVCFCFSVSPQPFVAQVNRATAETAKAQATEEGLGPVLAWFKRLFDQLLQRHLGLAELEFVWIDDREMDPSSADTIDVADVKAGIRTINEVRMSRGLDPLPGGDRLMVATGAGYVPITQTTKPQAPAAKLAKSSHVDGASPVQSEARPGGRGSTLHR
ncbi:MAG TPA: phage portal protein [Rhizomicrobium sp.]|nr:phage portal protein [Rhizomicrobium sp.]